MKQRFLSCAASVTLMTSVALTACSSSKPADAALTSSVPTKPHKHIQTFAFIDGTGKPYTFGTHWKRLEPYVDYAVVNAQAVNALAALGIKTGFYVTAHTICIARTYGECQPDASIMPESAFIHSCSPPYGRVMWNPEESENNPHPFYQFLGDVHSPELVRQWNSFLDQHRHDDDHGILHYDFAFEDNAMVPGDNLSWQHYYVQGSSAEQSPRPYCGYSNQQFMRDELHFENQAHFPLILNALNASDRRPQASLASTYLPQSKNAIGAMLEYIYGSTINGPDREKEGDDIWRSEENTELAMVNGHKVFIGYAHNGGNDEHALDIRGYQYASLLLSFDQRFVALAEDGQGAKSGFALNPEIGFVATDPLVPSPTSIEGLRASTGAYVREFRSCSMWGKPIGACVAIVNPSSTDSVDVPKLAQSYTHSLAISGSGVIAPIDNGRISLQRETSQAPLRPKDWRIFTQ